MPNKPRISRSLQDELNWKENLIRDFLYKGYKEYAKTLRNYNVNFSRSVPVAAVDAKNKIIYVNPEYVNKDKDLISMLIRHELLHALLNHKNRAMHYWANAFGLDPENLSEEDAYKLLIFTKGRPLALWSNFATSELENPAADLDLARYYLAIDQKISHELGGLVREDYPEYKDLSFEELMERNLEEEEELLYRLSNKSFGDIDTDGNWVETSKGTNEFDTNVIADKDVRYISIPSEEEIHLIERGIPELYKEAEALVEKDSDAAYMLHNWANRLTNILQHACWLRDAAEDDSLSAPVSILSRGSLKVVEAFRPNWILPIISVKHLSLYKPDTNGQFKYKGQFWLKIPKTSILIAEVPYANAVPFSKSTDPFNTDYDESRVKEILDAL